ncbi:preprotein translocase subunit SecG [Comamonas serinivorans]|uniref:Protein-export membrane protein SecG n=1 Tax=Comamonas serinivorans TaxID=1082851 RepID=A0A1Y0ESL5_9BURK|nr:preprotein translocase subunit SecG [Comamonas serinivorans]ARU06664.1 preprotein translocase subunit SecG [Comamonas serinivorans]
MSIFATLLLVLQIASALAMIGLILLQHGKGADMGAAFGSGSSGSLFGASGSANFLSRSTAVAATVFLATTLALAATGGPQRGAAGSGSVFGNEASTPAVPTPAASIPAPTASEVAAPAASVPAPAASGVGAIPGQ